MLASDHRPPALPTTHDLAFHLTPYADLLRHTPTTPPGILGWPIRLVRRMAKFVIGPWLDMQTVHNQAVIKALHDDQQAYRTYLEQLSHYLVSCRRDLDAVIKAQRLLPRAVVEALERSVIDGQAQPAAPRAVPTQASKRLAWLSPMPPTASGIADYSADLLKALPQHLHIDWIIDPQQSIVDPALTAKYLTLTAPEAIARHAVQPYDLFVYHLGNSGYHVYMLELLRRFGGLVVLHDFYLGGLVAVSRQRGLWPTTVEEELEFEGETHLLDWKRKGAVSEEVLRQLVPENTRLLSMADAVLVHSSWTCQRVRRLVDVPVARVPHMMPLTEQVEAVVRRRELGLPEDAFIVCSLGHHGHTKRMHSLLRAVANVHESLRRRVQIVIVGPMQVADQDKLRQFAAELGMEAQLRLTGFVGMAEFNAYIQAADVCVQLRYPTNGETSGSVLRALAAGTPVITSDQGPMAELPDDAVCKVRTPQFEGRDLTALLEQLDADPARRAALGAAGREYAARHLDPAIIAAGYAAVIEQTIARRTQRQATPTRKAG